MTQTQPLVSPNANANATPNSLRIVGPSARTAQAPNTIVSTSNPSNSMAIVERQPARTTPEFTINEPRFFQMPSSKIELHMVCRCNYNWEKYRKDDSKMTSCVMFSYELPSITTNVDCPLIRPFY